MKRFAYYQPRSLDEAFGLMKKHNGGARYVAGGTDAILRVKQKVWEPDALISLRWIDELLGISSEDGFLILGSMVLWREIETDPLVRQCCPALAQAASVVANPQIRNVATLGGNLCNAAPSADGAPPLMVMQAVLAVSGPDGEREVPIKEFFQGPGRHCLNPHEVLKEIRIPIVSQNTGMAFIKTGRVNQDIAVSNVAVMLEVEGEVCTQCRISAGAVGPVPLRLEDTERLIEGHEMTADLLQAVQKKAALEVTPITDVRSTEEYRRTVTGVMVKRAVAEALENARQAVKKPDMGRGNALVPETLFDEPTVGPYDSPGRKQVRFRLNGQDVAVEVESHKMLSRVLREDFEFTGTKEGCGQGECGACTILINGKSVNACLFPAFEVDGKIVTTIEGLVGEGNQLHAIQKAFVENGGIQCGFCTPGMIMSTRAMLDQNPNPSEEEIRRGISGNLCRCTGYVQIVESIKKAAETGLQNEVTP